MCVYKYMYIRMSLLIIQLAYLCLIKVFLSTNLALISVILNLVFQLLETSNFNNKVNKQYLIIYKN